MAVVKPCTTKSCWIEREERLNDDMKLFEEERYTEKFVDESAVQLQTEAAVYNSKKYTEADLEKHM